MLHPNPRMRVLGPRRVAVAVAAYLFAAIAANAYTRTVLFDGREIDREPIDNAWRLELPWRAARGQWVGRDFQYPMGPLWQALALLGGRPGPRTAGRALAGQEAVFSIVGLLVAAFVATRVARGGWPRLAVFCGLAVLLGWIDVLRACLSVLAVVLWLWPRRDGPPRVRDLVPAATVTIAAMLVSFDRGPLTFAGVTAAAVALAVGHAVRREPWRPALVRYATYLAALVGIAVLSSGVAAFLGASPLGYVRGSLAIVGEYSAVMNEQYRSGAFALDAVVVVLGATAVLAVALLRSEPESGALLAAAIPLAAPAAFRSDVSHVFSGVVPALASLFAVAARQWESGRSRSALVAAALPLLFLVGWIGRAPERFARFTPKVFVTAVQAATGELLPDRAYRSDVLRVAAFLRERKREDGIRCASLYPAGTVAAPLSDVDGPAEILLPWTERFDEETSRAIRRMNCPWHVQRNFSFTGRSDFFPNWYLTVAERYEAARALGPAVFAMRRRERDAPAVTRSLGFERSGREWVPVPGSATLLFDRFVPADRLLRVTYTIEAPKWARILGALPGVDFAFDDSTDGDLYPHFVVFGKRTTQIIPVDAAVAEARWMLGHENLQAASVDRMVWRLWPGHFASPGRVRLRVHHVDELVPSAPVRERGTGCVSNMDIGRAIRRGRVFPVAVGPTFHGREMTMVPNPWPEPLAEVFAPIRPCPDSCLRTVLLHHGWEGDGVGFQAHILEDEVRTLILEERLRPGESRPIEIPLSRWAGRDVTLRLGTLAGGDTLGDEAVLDGPGVFHCECEPSVGLAKRVREGGAHVENAHPGADHDSIFLHPNAAGAAPASVRIPVRPCSDSCLMIGELVDANPEGRGDGVDFQIDAIDGRETIPLLRRTVRASGTRQGAPPRDEIPLGRFAGRSIEIRLTTLPRASNDFDWATFVVPIVQACR